MNKILININICLLVLLFVVVTVLFILCLTMYKFDEKVEWKHKIEHIKIKPNEFICRINLADFDYRKMTIESLIHDVLLLPDRVRIDYNAYKGCFEVDNYPYEATSNNGYLYIYKRELKWVPFLVILLSHP